jgi:hypothetical protein
LPWRCTLSRTVVFLLLSLYPKQRPEIRGNRLRFVIELVPGKAGDRVAGDGEDAIPSPVLAKSSAALVSLPAIELDDLPGPGPVAVDPEALGAGEDPVVEARQR